MVDPVPEQIPEVQSKGYNLSQGQLYYCTRDKVRTLRENSKPGRNEGGEQLTKTPGTEFSRFSQKI